MATKKLTIEDLIQKKITTEKESVKEFHSEELGGIIEVRKIPVAKVLNLVSGLENSDVIEQYNVNFQLIYEACPVFRAKELQKQFEVAEPFEVVKHLFNDNLGEINKLSQFILNFYGLSELPETVKKQ